MEYIHTVDKVSDFAGSFFVHAFRAGAAIARSFRLVHFLQESD